MGDRTQAAPPPREYAGRMKDFKHPVIYCYDGSDAAKHALRVGKNALGERKAIVLTVWDSSWAAVAATPYVLAPQESMEEMDKAVADLAVSCAWDGASLVTGAKPETRQAHGSTWRTILDFAEEQDASIVVIGSRGRGALASALLGSVSHGLINHSHIPVIVVAPEDETLDPSDATAAPGNASTLPA